MLTAARLRELLSYDPETGVFRWNVNRRAARADDVAGSIDQFGYLIITIDGKRYPGQRLAWLYMTGEWPEFILDHKDRIKHRNVWSNIRPSDHSKNALNQGALDTSVSGVRGVWMVKGRWYAHLTIRGKRQRRGPFATIEEATIARKDIEQSSGV